MIDPKARVRLIDKNKLKTESIEVLNSLDKIYSAFKKLKKQENIYFHEIEIGMKLSWAVRDYIRALNSNNEKDREMAVEKMKLYLANDIYEDDENIIDDKTLKNNQEIEKDENGQRKFKSGVISKEEYLRLSGKKDITPLF